MQFKHTAKLLKKLKTRLGDDLTYSVILDEGEYYIGVSTERSDTQFYKSGKSTQHCQIQEKEFSDDLSTLINKVVPLFEDILCKTKQDDEENV